MANQDIDATWRIEFNQQELSPIAIKIVSDLRDQGVKLEEATYTPPRASTLGTPEIIISILVTEAAKAIIVAGLHSLGKVLASEINYHADRRAQIVLRGEKASRRRFPISLRNISKDALNEFIEGVTRVVKEM